VRRPRGFVLCGGAAVPVWPPVEGMAMAMDVEPSCAEMIRPVGRSDRPKWAAFANLRTNLVVLSIVVFIGFVTWGMLSGPSGARSERTTAPSAVMVAQNASTPDPINTPTRATFVAAAVEAAAPTEAAPVDGLKISWQSWRRGGLGSKAQVTLTVRNGNGYAVKDIEISCAFSRRDGSHLTDRKRTIHDTVKMKSRRTFARLHVGFVNINADKAKCSPIAANRI
jgi:hypothetical protein